jgi:hypothetical protein
MRLAGSNRSRWGIRTGRFATAPETLLGSISAFVVVRHFKPLIFFDQDIPPGPTMRSRAIRVFLISAGHRDFPTCGQDAARDSVRMQQRRVSM